MPVNPLNFEYEFAPSGLVEMREKLGVSQANLSRQLDVPVNTISRWERGETTPDANSLAALYSISKGMGVEPKFFQRRAGMAVNLPERVKSDFIEVIRQTGGKPVMKTNLGQSLRTIMDKYGVATQDLELSKSRSTTGLLNRLEAEGRIRVNQDLSDSKAVSIQLNTSLTRSRTKYFTIQRKGRKSFELTVVGKDGQKHVMNRIEKGKDGHFTDEGQYRQAIERAVKENCAL